MGITRLKKLLADEFTRAFTTRELHKYILNLNINLDMYTLTGYPATSAVPRREAAIQVVEYFHKSNKIIQLLNLYLYSAEHGFKGEHIVFNNLRQVVHEMNECGFKYNRDLKKVVMVDGDEKRQDWGYLKEGNVYNFCFLMIDICKNSKMVRKYAPDLIRQTYINFKNYVKNVVEGYNGRIWVWEGDGGLIVFHIKDFINQAVYAGVKILSNLPVFNTLQSLIEDDILVRIALTSGSTEYKENILSINSDIINEVKNIEKDHTQPMTISITNHTYQHINSNLRKYFNKEVINDYDLYQLKLPITGDKI